MTTINLSGVIPPVTTPFDERGDIQYDSVKAQVDWLVDCGVSGIAVGGSTGEGHTLEADEFRTLIETALEAASLHLRTAVRLCLKVRRMVVNQRGVASRRVSCGPSCGATKSKLKASF